MDNATSNDVLARSLATLLIKHDVEFDAKSGQIRCLPHVINLVFQWILSKLSSGDVADPDINDYYEEAKTHSVHYDPNNNPDVQEMEEDFVILSEKIVSSPQRRYAFRQQVRKFYENLRLIVIRDVKTRWNCTHAMIKRALILQNGAIVAGLAKLKTYHDKALSNEFKIIATDWFQKIDMLMYKEARNVVKRTYDQYRQKRLQPQTAPSTPTTA
ncbi:hypothetical protein FRC00_013672, partial [Tulasnella sp. 408]